MSLTHIADIAGIVGAVLGIGAVIAGLARWWRRRGALLARIETEGLRVLRAAVTARPMLEADGFEGRASELEQLARLMANSSGPIWVTGPPQAGKSWLVSHHLHQAGLSKRAARFELRSETDFQGLLEGLSMFLRASGAPAMRSDVSTRKLTVTDRAEQLSQALSAAGLVVFLDSYEQIGGAHEIHDLVKSLHESPGRPTVIIGTTDKPDWADEAAEVKLAAIEPAAGLKIIERVGADPKDADRLQQLTGGLPGLLELAGAQSARGEFEPGARIWQTDARHLARALLAHAFAAGSPGMQRLWIGLCLLPAAASRETAEATSGVDQFDEAWGELVRNGALEPRQDRAELHPLARQIGCARPSPRRAPARALARGIAQYYADFVEEEDEYPSTVLAEMENVLAAAALAYRNRQWATLWRIGVTLDPLLSHAGGRRVREALLYLCHQAARLAKDKERRAEFAYALGRTRELRGDPGRADDWHRESLSLSRETGERSSEGLALASLGRLAHLQGRLPQAESKYRDALRIQRSLDMRAEESDTRRRLGLLALDRGSLAGARRASEKSLELARALNSGTLQSNALHALGLIEAAAGSADAAAARFQESLDAARTAEDKAAQAAALVGLGAAARAQGNLDQAQRLCQESLALAETVESPGAAWRARAELARVASERGDLDQAGALCEESLAEVRETGDVPGEARLLWDMARLAEKQRDPRAAAERLRDAVAMFDEMGLVDRDEAREELDRLRKDLQTQGH
jgi:tetratricopeptide (TPR) repeat protein